MVKYQNQLFDCLKTVVRTSLRTSDYVVPFSSNHPTLGSIQQQLLKQEIFHEVLQNMNPPSSQQSHALNISQNMGPNENYVQAGAVIPQGVTSIFMKKLRFGSRYLFVALEVNFINIKSKIVLQHILNFFFKDKLFKLLKYKKMDLKKIYSSTIFYPPIHLFIHSGIHLWYLPINDSPPASPPSQRS